MISITSFAVLKQIHRFQNEKYSPENEEDGDEETEKKKDEVIKVEEVSVA